MFQDSVVWTLQRRGHKILPFWL